MGVYDALPGMVPPESAENTAKEGVGSSTNLKGDWRIADNTRRVNTHRWPDSLRICSVRSPGVCCCGDSHGLWCWNNPRKEVGLAPRSRWSPLSHCSVLAGLDYSSLWFIGLVGFAWQLSRHTQLLSSVRQHLVPSSTLLNGLLGFPMLSVPEKKLLPRRVNTFL